MPAEWETHEATWLAWPHHPTDWPGKLGTIRWVYAEIVRKIAAGETVRVLVRSKEEATSAARYLRRAGADMAAVEFLVHPTNRGWTRDSGPLFVRRCLARKIETAIVHFHFSAWAKYADWQKDRRVPETAARHLGKRLFDAQGLNFIDNLSCHRLNMALRSICLDDMGKSAVRDGLKLVKLKNVKDKAAMKIAFEGGVLEMHCAYALGAEGMFNDNAIREVLEKNL